MKRPNILFIMTDQQRFDTFGRNNDIIKTPNLDALIEESVFFENARCSNPSCVPSRAAIMTGKMPSECACPAYITELPQSETTFMKRLQDAGYHTAVIGKQHFAGSKIDKGYDEEMIIDGHGAFAPPNDIAYYLRFLAENGISPEKVYKKSSMSGGDWLVDVQYHIDNFIGDLGTKWIEKQEKTNDTPWFFNLSFSGPHHPYDLEGTKYADMYSLEDMTVPNSSYEDLLQKPEQYRKMDMYSDIYLKNYTKEQFQKSKRSYYANMTLMDEKIGEAIQALKDKGLYDDTMIVFTTDHGDFLGDYGLVEKLQCLADPLMRVPLFIKPPVKGFKGTTVLDEVLNIDIASTCLTLAGAEVPDELSNFPYNPYWDSSVDKNVRSEIFMEAGGIKGVIVDGVKVVSYIDRDYGELYDLKNDPEEVKNLWESAEYQTIKMKGLQRIMSYMYKAIPKSEVPWNIGTPSI